VSIPSHDGVNLRGVALVSRPQLCRCRRHEREWEAHGKRRRWSCSIGLTSQSPLGCRSVSSNGSPEAEQNQRPTFPERGKCSLARARYGAAISLKKLVRGLSPLTLSSFHTTVQTSVISFFFSVSVHVAGVPSLSLFSFSFLSILLQFHIFFFSFHTFFFVYFTFSLFGPGFS
jgi:hypothetical protein